MAKDNQLHRRIEHDIFGTTPRKKTINSKKKGNANERAVAKFLFDWTGLEFNRVPNSGGLRWKNAEGITGDLVCEDKSFAFSIETKHYKKLSMTSELRRNSVVFTIWEQCERDAKRSFKMPMLILRENKMPAGEFIIYVQFQLGKILPATSFGVMRDDRRLFGYHSKELLANVSYEKFLSSARNL